MGVFDGLPATDVDIAEVAIGDFATLTSRSERVAYGEDGSIPSGSFVLTSAFPFEAQGVQAGHALVIEKITPTKAGQPSRDVNDILPVASASGKTVTLRRLGYGPGQGAYPRGNGLGAVTFYVPSLLAQIRTAYDDALRKLNLTATSTLVDPADLRLVTILMVLRGLYFAQYRQSNDDTFKSKMGDLDAQIVGEMAGLTETYGDRAGPGVGLIVGDLNPIDPWRRTEERIFGPRWW